MSCGCERTNLRVAQERDMPDDIEVILKPKTKGPKKTLKDCKTQHDAAHKACMDTWEAGSIGRDQCFAAANEVLFDCCKEALGHEASFSIGSLTFDITLRRDEDG